MSVGEDGEIETAWWECKICSAVTLENSQAVSQNVKQLPFQQFHS